jgi:hypothetical protein
MIDGSRYPTDLPVQIEHDWSHFAASKQLESSSQASWTRARDRNHLASSLSLHDEDFPKAPFSVKTGIRW